MWSHWDDHKVDFPQFDNVLQYVQSARDFVLNPTPAMKIGLRTKTYKIGPPVMEKVFLDMSDGRFAVQIMSGPEAGGLKTFFPKNGGPAQWLEYWTNQNIETVIQ
jgi:hypothetical protein